MLDPGISLRVDIGEITNIPRYWSHAGRDQTSVLPTTVVNNQSLSFPKTPVPLGLKLTVGEQTTQIEGADELV